LEILQALGRYRYLRTGQIARLIFPENGTQQSARRRLKYLYHAGYIGRIQPLGESAISTGEMAYHLERAGLEMLEEDTLPSFSMKNQVKPGFLRHALAVSEFRLNLELAVKSHPEIQLHRVIMDFELRAHTNNAIGRRKYRLFDEVVDPIGKRKIAVHPDLLFVLRAGDDERSFQRLFFVEVDRGTEGLRVIADKLTGYHLYKRENVFKKYGEFDDFRVLIQTNSEKRAQNIGDAAKNFCDAIDVWTAPQQRADRMNLLHGRFWQSNRENERQSLLRRRVD